MTTRTRKSPNLTDRTDRELIAILDHINSVLFDRHGEDPNEEQGIEGLATLTSAIDELHQEIL